MSDIQIISGDCVDILPTLGPGSVDLIVTDPPYAFGGDGDEHAISAAVAVGLRESARVLADGRWMIVFCASSWRSTSYMVESVRGILRPVRIGHWCKPKSRTRTRTPGWQWASVHAIAFCKGRALGLPAEVLDHIVCPPVTKGRRAELPPEVADWAVKPFAVMEGTFLDPFAGSGALAEAASRAGMKATGIERQTPKAKGRVINFVGVEALARPDRPATDYLPGTTPKVRA